MKTGYNHDLTQALRRAECKEPLRLLACCVIALWLQDCRRAPAEPIGEEWADLAGVPAAWLKEVASAQA